MGMKDIINEFLAYLTLERKYSDYTQVNYAIDLDKYAQFLAQTKRHYLKIKYQDLSEYIIYLKKSGYGARTINRQLSALRSFYHYLVQQQKIKSNPFDLVKGVKTEKRLPNYFKYEEFIAMLNVLNKNDPLNIRNRLILELLLATGMRVSELVNIKLIDLDLKTKELKVIGKGRKERIVFFGPEAASAIQNYLDYSRSSLLKDKVSEYLLLNHLGNKLTSRGVSLIIEKVIEESAVTSKVSPHTFRHTFATLMLNNGCNIKSVQELLGHVSLDTTSIYTHLTNDEIRVAYLKSHPRAKK